MDNSSSNQQSHPTMKRNLLLCVDAFGTLFRPRSPIAEQYGQVARDMGIKISDEDIAREFKSGKSFPILSLGGGWSRD
jgi:hypothetical protein